MNMTKLKSEARMLICLMIVRKLRKWKYVHIRQRNPDIRLSILLNIHHMKIHFHRPGMHLFILVVWTQYLHSTVAPLEA